MFYAHTYSLALSLKQIAWYSLSLMEFPLPTFTKAFQMSLDYLPSAYDASNPVFKMFFESFGTSVVTKADMGGLVWAETWFESCLERKMTDICIDDEVSKGWWIAHHHTSDHKCDEHMKEDFWKMSEWHYEMLGGTDKVIYERLLDYKFLGKRHCQQILNHWASIDSKYLHTCRSISLNGRNGP